MKYIFSLFVVLTLVRECKNTGSSETETPTPETEEPVAINQLSENTTFEYSAISRGIYNKIVITSQSISVQKDHESDPIAKKCEENDWSKLGDAFSTIDLKQMPELKAPTEARFFDGAATAQLIIIFEDQTYISQGFDHGTPPQPIEALVKEILSLSENVE